MSPSLRHACTVLAAIVAAIASPLEAAHARPNYGAYAGVYMGTRDGGEGSYTASSAKFDRSTSAMASASLGDGTLHAFSAVPRIACRPSCSYRPGTMSVARYWDTVTFHNGQNLGLADLNLRIDGQLSNTFAQASVRWYRGWAHEDFFQRLDHYAPAQLLTSGDTLIDDGLAIPLGDTTMFIFAELYTSAAGNTVGDAVADFGNTLHFEWVLPEGVTVSSASGVFMTAATAPIPEPQTYALMLAGLGVVGFVARRRRA